MAKNSAPSVLFSAGSERVKMIDIHPKEPILIAADYAGRVTLWNYETTTMLKSFDTGTGRPVRCARFIPKLQAFACGADDFHIRVFNYNTMERIAMFQAQDDFIRSIAVHSQLPILLTCSDDMSIRQWDWSKGWSLQCTYAGHTHYCMAITFNPNDSSTFASASLDCMVKVWSLHNPVPNYQLEGHEDGVNCVEYYPRGDKPYLLSGSDDQTVRLWDYQTKACLQVFSFHTNNVSAVLFHPDQPLIFTVAEDTEMKVISSETFRLLYNLDHTLKGRAWTMAAVRHSNILAVGYDNGFAIFKVGDGKPVYSMDASGRVVVAVGNELTKIEVKGIPAGTPDGETIPCTSKDLGSVEATAVSIAHSPNGQFMTIIGERDYTILFTLSLRPKSYGQCLSFVWGPENGSYAVLESPTVVKVFKAFKEQATIMLSSAADKLYDGPLFGVRTPTSVIFYDWSTLCVIRQIDECPTAVKWSSSGELVALSTAAAVFILKFNAEQVEAHLEAAGNAVGSDGLDFAFDLVEEVDEKTKDIVWAGDCLVFVSQSNRLNYYIGGETSNLAVLPRGTFLLGYLPKEDRLVFVDKERNITSYLLKVSVIEYMTAIIREDFEAAASQLAAIDASYHPKLARFLQSRNLLELAFEVSTEDEQRFDLAIQLNNVDAAREIAARIPTSARWKQVGDLALELAELDVATDCFKKCGDYGGLLLIYSSLNNVEEISRLGDECLLKGRGNVAFTCFHKAQRYADCVDLLAKTGKFGEAAFYARTYAPECIEDAVRRWKTSLSSLPRIREAIANPADYPNLFPTISPSALQGPSRADKGAAGSAAALALPAETHSAAPAEITVSASSSSVPAPPPAHNEGTSAPIAVAATTTTTRTTTTASEPPHPPQFVDPTCEIPSAEEEEEEEGKADLSTHDNSEL